MEQRNTELSPAEQQLRKTLRINRERQESLRAKQKAAGSWALGLIAIWKLVTVETDPYLWVGALMVAFGLAQWEQIVKAFRNGKGD